MKIKALFITISLFRFATPIWAEGGNAPEIVFEETTKEAMPAPQPTVIPCGQRSETWSSESFSLIYDSEEGGGKIWLSRLGDCKDELYWSDATVPASGRALKPTNVKLSLEVPAFYRRFPSVWDAADQAKASFYFVPKAPGRYSEFGGFQILPSGNKEVMIVTKRSEITVIDLLDGRSQSLSKDLKLVHFRQYPAAADGSATDVTITAFESLGEWDSIDLIRNDSPQHGDGSGSGLGSASDMPWRRKKRTSIWDVVYRAAEWDQVEAGQGSLHIFNLDLATLTLQEKSSGQRAKFLARGDVLAASEIYDTANNGKIKRLFGIFNIILGLF